jgi:hypothetical protein
MAAIAFPERARATTSEGTPPSNCPAGGGAYVAAECRARDPESFRQQTHLLFEQRKTAVNLGIFHHITICNRDALLGRLGEIRYLGH